ncbi:T9SS type A sorting domain-containing protein [Rubrivirga sp. IMCC45206]|uniref:T9SS type A sorting domain-containing protein n=1 Tax=Rubrivirga sp. IMCC45206 TaxID=3391614 RepID=UPI00399019BC
MYRVGVVAETTDGRYVRALGAPFRLLPGPVRTGDDEEAPLPVRFALSRPSPNPTSDHAEVTLDLPEPTDVLAELFDVRGRLIASGPHPPGTHGLPVDASELASGVYAVRVMAGDDEATRTVTVVR